MVIAIIIIILKVNHNIYNYIYTVKPLKSNTQWDLRIMWD